MTERSPIDNQGGRAPLHRDNQQWVLDYLIQETGKAYHFQGDGRGEFPKSVRSHAMIPKHLARQAAKLEAYADREYERGHGETAMDLYFLAADGYSKAQHPIFELNDEKRHLYGRLRGCYDKVIELAPYQIEHLRIPWNDTHVFGNLHLNPNASGPAPLVFYIPGCDAVKERYPHPRWNFAHQRGMHLFSFEGPGHAECNLAGIRMTSDNFEEAAGAALGHLLERPEIDAESVVLYANSFGSFWGARFAARDSRLKAMAATSVSLSEKYIQADLESPRWKQLWAFISQSETEAELDALLGGMTMDGYMSRISCPSLLTTGEYDPRAPLDTTFELFDQMTVPAELWVMEDQHHKISIGDSKGPAWGRASHGIVVDWLRDRLNGVPLEHPNEVVWIRGDEGPHHPNAALKRHWFE